MLERQYFVQQIHEILVKKIKFNRVYLEELVKQLGLIDSSFLYINMDKSNEIDLV